jgi:hypothetical protein
MRATRCRAVLLSLVAAALTAVAFTSPAAAEDPVVGLPAPGSSQSCIAAKGGFLLQINGFGTSFPANTTGTTTFTFANGDVVSLEATTTSDGIFHTATFTYDLRDPAIAALVGTDVYLTATFGDVFADMHFEFFGCPTAPDGKVACMEGGYLNYPALGFLNQGDCVSWIATKGKNEPGKNLP